MGDACGNADAYADGAGDGDHWCERRGGWGCAWRSKVADG